MDLRLEVSKIENLKKIKAIYEDGRQALKKMNIDQWQDGYPKEPLIIEDIKKAISYSVFYQNDLVATVVFFIGIEEDYNKIDDGRWISNSSIYGVIHRIAVKEGFKGKNVASFIISKAVEMAKKEQVKSIRIDTHEDNIPMQKMLKKNNFIHCGLIHLKDGSPRWAFEKLLD